MSGRDTQRSVLRNKINRLEVFKFDPNLSRIYFTHLSELPDRCRDYPERAQRAYMVTFNNNLRRWGVFDVAAKAANKAMMAMVDRIKAERMAKEKPSAPDIDMGIFQPRRIMVAGV